MSRINETIPPSIVSQQQISENNHSEGLEGALKDDYLADIDIPDNLQYCSNILEDELKSQNEDTNYSNDQHDKQSNLLLQNSMSISDHESLNTIPDLPTFPPVIVSMVEVDPTNFALLETQ